VYRSFSRAADREGLPTIPVVYTVEAPDAMKSKAKAKRDVREAANAIVETIAGMTGGASKAKAKWGEATRNTCMDLKHMTLEHLKVAGASYRRHSTGLGPRIFRKHYGMPSGVYAMLHNIASGNPAAHGPSSGGDSQNHIGLEAHNPSTPRCICCALPCEPRPMLVLLLSLLHLLLLLLLLSGLVFR
jgi:hypothetical protein